MPALPVKPRYSCQLLLYPDEDFGRRDAISVTVSANWTGCTLAAVNGGAWKVICGEVRPTRGST